MPKKTRKKTGTTPSLRASRQTSRTSSTSKAAAKPPQAAKTLARSTTAVRSRSPSKLIAKKPAAKKAEPNRSVRGAGELAVGDAIPPFFLPRDGGQSVSLADYAGRKLVIFFYPRADTPGCTLEAMDFSRLASAFAASQTAVLGASADPVTAQNTFRDKHQLAVPLLSDENHELLKPYGVWGQKSMYGKTFMGILRTTVLVDADGRIARIWRNVRVKGHADDVLAAARAL